MADYTVNIQAKATGFAEIERRINSLKNQKIKVQVDFAQAGGQGVGGVTGYANQVASTFSGAFNKATAKYNNLTYANQLHRMRTDVQQFSMANTKTAYSAQKQVEKMEKAVNNMTTAGTRKAMVDASRMADQANKTMQNMYQMQKRTMEVPISDKRLSGMQKQLETFYVKNSKMWNKAYGNTTYGNQMTAWMEELNAEGGVSVKRADEITAAYNRLQASVTRNNYGGASFLQSLGSTFKTAGSFLLSYGGINRAVTAFTNAVSSLKEMDSTLTEISKVSGLTDTQITQLGKDSFNIASRWGRTAQDYLVGIQEMYRAGYRGESAQGMAELSIKAQAAGDLSANDANSYLIATKAAFGYSDATAKAEGYKDAVEQLNVVLDGQNFIANNNAVSMQDMSEATQKAASMASTLGVSEAELSALIGVAQASTQQGGDVIGNALKSLMINLQNLSNSKVVNTFDKLGISQTKFVNGSEQMKTPIEILGELSKVYQELDAADPLKQEILTNIGQKRQANVLSAILSNWDTSDNSFTSMLEDYNDGLGSAEREAEKSANNWQGTLNKLQNSWQAFVNTFVDSGTVKNVLGFANGITKAMTGLSNFVSPLGMMTGGFGFVNSLRGNTNTVGSWLSAKLFNAKTVEPMPEMGDMAGQADAAAEALNRVGTAGTTAATGVSHTAQAMRDTANTTGQAVSGLSRVGSVLGTIGKAALSMGIDMLIGMALNAGLKAIDNYIHRVEYAKEAMQTSFGDLSTASSDLTGTQTELDSINAQISELQGKGNLTFVEQQQLSQLRETRAELEKTKVAQQQIYDQAAREAGDNAVDMLDKMFGTKDLVSSDKEYQEARDKRIKNYQEYWGYGAESEISWEPNGDNDVMGLLEYQKQLVQQREELAKDTAANADKITAKDEEIQAVTDKLNDQRIGFDQIVDGLAGVKEGDMTSKQRQARDVAQYWSDAIRKQIDAENWQVDKVNELLNDERFAGVRDKIDEIILESDGMGVSLRDVQVNFKDFSAVVARYGTDALKNFIQSENDLVLGTSDVKDSVELANESFNSFVGNAQSSFDAIDKFNAAMASSVGGSGLTIGFEIDDDGIRQMTGDVADLLEGLNLSVTDEQVSQLLETTATGIHLNSSALQELTKAQEDAQRADFINEYTALQSALSDAQSRGDSEAVAAIQQQIAELELLSSAYEGATNAYKKWLDSQSQGEEGDMYDAISSTAVDRAKELAEAGLVGTNEFRALAELMSGMDLSNASPEEIKQAYEQAAPAMEQYFTKGEEGLGAMQDSLIEMGYLAEDANGKLAFTDGANIEDMASDLGISVEATEAALRKMTDYDWEIDFTSIGLDTIESNLRGLSESDLTRIKADLELDPNASIEEVAQAIQDQNYQVKTDVDTSAIDDIKSQEIIMKVKADPQGFVSDVQSQVSNVASSALSIAGSVGDAFRSGGAESKEVTVTADTGQMESQIESAVSGMSPKVQVDADPSPGIATAQAAFASATAIMPVQAQPTGGQPQAQTVTTNFVAGTQATATNQVATVDYQKGDQEDPTDAVARVNYLLGTTPSSVPSISGTANYLLGSYPKSLPPIHQTVYQTTVKTNATGTAQVGGIAAAQGFWGVGENVRGLTGELGQEMIVRNGQFFTVGDNGAEFVDLKPNDIVFNHKQTEQILKYGRINSRGHALVTGSAFVTKTSGSGSKLGSTTKTTTPSGSGNSGGGNSGGGNGKTNKGGNNNNNKKNQKETKEYFDWIEVKLDRIERKIKNIKTVADSAFENFGVRISYTENEIGETNIEIAQQTKAQKRYSKAAKKVGLKKKYRKLVDNGKIDIDAIKNDKLKEKIKQYQEWRNKSLDARDAQVELNETLKELYKQKFDLVQSQYEHMLTEIENKSKLFDEQINKREAEGFIISAAAYQKLIDKEGERVKKLSAEQKALQTKMKEAVAHGIKTQSDAWYEMKEAIADVDQELAEANTQIAEWNKQIRELGYGSFERVIKNIEDLANEASFLKGLMEDNDMFDENGQRTQYGMASLGMTLVAYDTYMAESQRYAKEITTLESQLAKSPYNQELIDKKQEYVEAQRQAIENAYKEKQAMKTLIEDGIKAQVDSLKDAISEYEKLLDAQKDAYDYQRNIEKQVENINALRKQLAAWTNDDSEEGAARRQKARKELEEAQESLADTQEQRRIAQIKELLSDLSDDYDEMMNQRLDKIDVEIDAVRKEVEAAKGDIQTTLTTVAGEFGTTMSTAVSNSIGTGVAQAVAKIQADEKAKQDAAAKAAQEKAAAQAAAKAKQTAQQTATNNAATKVAASINRLLNSSGSSGNGVPSKIKSADEVRKFIDAYASKAKNKKSSYSDVNKVIYGLTGGKVLSTSELKDLAKRLGIKYDNASKSGNLYKKLKKLKASGFRSGTFGAPYSDYFWTQEGGQELIARTSDGAMLTRLGRGDKVFTNTMTENLWNLARNPADAIVAPALRLASATGAFGSNDVDLTFNLPNVTNSAEFIRELQSNPKFEEIIQKMTLGRANGRGTLHKYSTKV